MPATPHERDDQAGESSHGATHERVPMGRKIFPRSKKSTSRILKWMGIRNCFCSQPEKLTKPKPETEDPTNRESKWSPPPPPSKPHTSQSVSFKKHAPDISDHIKQFNDPKYDATNYQSCAISRYFQSLPADWDSQFLVEKHVPEKREHRLFSTKSGRCDNNDGKSVSDSAAWTTMEHLERFFSMEGATKSIHHSIGGVDHGVSGVYQFDGEVLDENMSTRVESSNMNFRAYVSLGQPMSVTQGWTSMQATK